MTILNVVARRVLTAVAAPRRRRAAWAALALAGAGPVSAQTRVLDDFSDSSLWRAIPGANAHATIAQGSGSGGGHALRLDFELGEGGGYATLRRDLELEIPANYELTFRIRGTAPRESVEIKLSDRGDRNVWWARRPEFTFPSEWATVRITKRQIQYAWGLAWGSELRRTAALEIAVVGHSAGKGTVWIADLAFTPRDPVAAYAGTPIVASSSSALPRHGAAAAVDQAGTTAWHSDPAGGEAQWLAADLGDRREIGGVIVDWEDDFASRFRLEASDDGATWRTLRSVERAGGGHSYLVTPDEALRFVRLACERSVGGRGYGVRELRVQPPAFAASTNAVLTAAADDAPRGAYPRYFRGEQAFWTVVGTGDDPATALLSEDGAVEVGSGEFSIEPLVWIDGRLLTWADVRESQTLADGDLPIPSVEWDAAGASLETTAFADPGPAGPTLYVRYRVRNRGAERTRPKLFLAIRPHQVNPPWESAGTGGATVIDALSWDGRAVTVDGVRTVTPLVAPTRFGAWTFDEGGSVAVLGRGTVPPTASVRDATRLASGALEFDLDLAAGAMATVAVAVPLRAGSPAAAPAPGEGALAALEGALAATRLRWRATVDTVGLRLPPAGAALAQTLRSNLAWILVDRDGPALRPGTRCYARSWIRDGAMISAALLRLGHEGEAKAFLEWFAAQQEASGRVPCCVDRRGPDRVDENDAPGEFLFLAGDVWRYTRDLALVGRLWPNLERAVGYIEALRQQRRTEAYRTPDKAMYFGLLPESISHEGYSAHPMHSYWDDTWALCGLDDAVELARVMGHADEAARWAVARDEFRSELLASLARTMEHHHIDYLPACVELGELDATATTVALSPGKMLAQLPRAAVERTFERYWQDVSAHRDGTKAWDAYVPYELRSVGAFVRLGWRQRANALLDGFMRDRQPPGWNQWPEIVYHDVRAPRHLGDLPHAWVSSDYIRSFLDMLAYEREDGALVLAAGVPPEWFAAPGGVGVDGLRTPDGRVTYTLAGTQRELRLSIPDGCAVPRGGLVLPWPFAGTPRSATLDGAPLPIGENGEVVIRRAPADVVVRE